MELTSFSPTDSPSMESPLSAESAPPTPAPRNDTPSPSPRAEAQELRMEEKERTADTEEDPTYLSLLSEVSVLVEEPAEDASEKAEEAAAKERAEREAQRQLLATEELVYTERNYLRLLQVCTCTIRSNLQKLQVLLLHRCTGLGVS